MLKFISFGSGSSGNCYYLATSTDALIIDAGVGVRMLKKYMKEYGLNLHSVHYILITHDHADHIKCVGSISHELGVPVYCTEKVHDGIDRNYCVTRKIANDKKHVLQPQYPVERCFYLRIFWYSCYGSSRSGMGNFDSAYSGSSLVSRNFTHKEICTS